MKRKILVAVLFLIVGATAFVIGGWLCSRRLLDDYNEMASGNFSVALSSFRDDYQFKRIRFFGEVKEKSTFTIDDYEFVVIPTVLDRTSNAFNPEYCNMASHVNGMVVMLACTWIVNGNPCGENLLSKLKQIIPNYKLSDSNNETVALTNLEKGSVMMKSEADQWSWRMGDLPVNPKVQQPDTGQMATNAKEFRYHHMDGVTGLGNVVVDSKGKETTIIISKDSDPEALAVLDAFQDAELCGTKKPELIRGAHFDQHLILVGEFTSDMKRTENVKNGAGSEPYRDFKVTGFKAVFPFCRFVTAPKGNEIDGPFLMETHFGFDTLFPNGISIDKKLIDLERHSVKPKEE